MDINRAAQMTECGGDVLGALLVQLDERRHVARALAEVHELFHLSQEDVPGSLLDLRVRLVRRGQLEGFR